jgi:hypothetical protein
MRTTLDIADDVLLAAKEVAQREKRSAGAVLSDWARTALHWQPDAPRAAAPRARSPLARYGIEPLPAPRGAAGKVTNALIDRLRDEEGV